VALGNEIFQSVIGEMNHRRRPPSREKKDRSRDRCRKNTELVVHPENSIRLPFKYSMLHRRLEKVGRITCWTVKKSLYTVLLPQKNELFHGVATVFRSQNLRFSVIDRT
jgi:hypothetical protein